MLAILGNKEPRRLRLGLPEARDNQGLRLRTGPPDLLPRLFQKIPALPKVPISLKSKPMSSWEKHDKDPPCRLPMKLGPQMEL